MLAPYPDIDTHAEGLLDTGDGNLIHWQASGNPEGAPVLILHGGPGSASSPSARRFFDPKHYRILQFDQRGCGKSLPNAAGPQADFATNTTWHLVADMERLRTHFAVGKWMLFGSSWGCTLALAYAETRPQHVAAMVLAGVTMTRRSEIDWLYRGLAPLFPKEWEAFQGGVPADRRNEDLVAVYHDLLHGEDRTVALKAARDWHAWEAASILIDPKASLPRRWADEGYLLTRARIITHYFRNAGWLAPEQLLRHADRLSGIPGILLQGRFDLEAPLVTAWDLSRAWPDARLTIVPNTAHSPSAEGMTAAIVGATNDLRRLDL